MKLNGIVLTVVILVLLTGGVKGQAVIEGKISMKKGWENRLYLAVLDDFNRNFRTIDTIQPGPDGSFYWKQPVNDSNILYRLLLPPQGGNEHSVVEGFADNFIYLLLQDNYHYRIRGDADSLYYSSSLSGNVMADGISRLKEFKRPFYQLVLNTIAERNQFPDSLTTINSKMMKAWEVQTEQYRENLKYFLAREDEPGLIILGLYYYYLASFGRYDADFFSQHIDRVGIDKYGVINHVKKRIGDSSTNHLGKILPNVVMEDEKKNATRVEAIDARYIVLDFWASWCRPCRKANTGYLTVVHKQLIKKKGLLVGISVDDNEMAWKEALRKDKTSWMQLIDPGGRALASTLKIYAFPWYMILDSGQRIIFETNNEMELKSFLEHNL